MKIIGIQFDIIWENKEANLARVEKLLQETNPSQGSLVILPEMFATGFSMNVRLTKEPPTSIVLEKLSQWAREFSINIIAGVVLPAPGAVRARNEAILYNRRGSCVGRYAKVHLFSLAGEDKYYEAGKDIVIWPVDDWKIMPAICYDLRFPELFRRAILRGADCIIVIANWPAIRQEQWQTLLCARAIENQCYVVGVNRVGKDPSATYVGGTTVVDPMGRVIGLLGNEEGILTVELNKFELQQWRRSFPALSDVRLVFETVK